MYPKVQGLVLRVTEYNDRDVLLTLLTKEYGRITVKARGARRKNSPLAVSCQLLVLSEFSLFEYKDSYVVNEAHVIELFQGLRLDICKLALATYMVQVVDLISQEDVPNSQMQPLILNCLYGLSNLNIPDTKVKTVFELRCACLAGYYPDLDANLENNETEKIFFDISEGCLAFGTSYSSTSSGIRMPVSVGIVFAMRYICACDPRKIFSFSLNEEALECLSYITEAYLSTQLEKGFGALDFYKSLLV
jgi:DNA repair protein RecO (recombination protein O)